MDNKDIATVLIDNLKEHKHAFLVEDNTKLFLSGPERVFDVKEPTGVEGLTIAEVWFCLKHKDSVTKTIIEDRKATGVGRINRIKQDKLLKKYNITSTSFDKELFLDDGSFASLKRTREEGDEPDAGKAEKRMKPNFEVGSAENFDKGKSLIHSLVDSIVNGHDLEESSMETLTQLKLSSFDKLSKYAYSINSGSSFDAGSFADHHSAPANWSSFSDMYKILDAKDEIRRKQERKELDAAAASIKSKRSSSSSTDVDDMDMGMDSFMGSNGASAGSSTSSSDYRAEREKAEIAKKVELVKSYHQKKVQEKFYIIVPNEATSLISMYNIEHLLKERHFVPHLKAKNDALKKRKPKPKYIRFSHKLLNHNERINVIVIDDPVKMNFKSRDWKRVVGVFTNGKSWQFDNFAPSHPTDIFTTYRGFYLHDKNRTVRASDPVKSWPVKIISIDTANRHRDQIIWKEIWESMESLILQKLKAKRN